MRIALALLLVAGCGAGDITTGDDTTGDDAPTIDGGGDDVPDATPANEPAGLMGTTSAHNAIRAGVGVGPLTWDPALAVIAQGWADQCVDQDAPIGLIDHNDNRSDTYPEYVGENVYGSGGSASGTDATALWASEESDYDYATNTCSGICGHYTQIVWRDTTKIGCGISSCPGLTYGNSVVCNYAPGGNVGGQRPY
jgi:pathogenesis-related protein 1